MIAVRVLCAAVVVLLTCGLPVLGQQKLPWRGSLAELDNFEAIINLSDQAVAQQEFRNVLSDPGFQFESVAIHAYAPSEACESVALWRRMANNYGALVLTYDGTNEKAIKGEWFNQLDSACSPSVADSTALYPLLKIEPPMPDIAELAEMPVVADYKAVAVPAAAMIAGQLFWEVLKSSNGEIHMIPHGAAVDRMISNGVQFVYTTAALPFAKQLAEFRGHCRLDDGASPPSEDTACYHYLSRSTVEEHRDFLLSSSSAVTE
ncbi:MAG: hypothetical protein OXI46_11395 [Gemmatimonadota bacterium]|nr:hypothetical protein [Gemmatimonadota bacterium]